MSSSTDFCWVTWGSWALAWCGTFLKGIESKFILCLSWDCGAQFDRDFSASGLQINKWIWVEEKTYKRAVLCCSQERHWESFHWVNALLIPLHVDTDICIWSGSVCIGSAFEFCTSHLFCAMVKFVFKVKLSFSMVRSMSVGRNVLTTYSFCLCERISFLNLLSG